MLGMAIQWWLPAGGWPTTLSSTLQKQKGREQKVAYKPINPQSPPTGSQVLLRFCLLQVPHLLQTAPPTEDQVSRHMSMGGVGVGRGRRGITFLTQSTLNPISTVNGCATRDQLTWGVGWGLVFLKAERWELIEMLTGRVSL